jgi:hypothetical protein
MTKRNQEIDVDAGAEFETLDDIPFGYALESAEKDQPVTIVIPPPTDSAITRLALSGIVVGAEGAISWRQGHLEHVARVYAADQRLAWRDYADDLTVALSADGGTFAALVDKARGETE